MGWWTRANGSILSQGALLPDCVVPVFPSDFGANAAAVSAVPTKLYDLIVLTQSCDLDPLNGAPPELVALCPVTSLVNFSIVDATLRERNKRNKVRAGQVPSLHLLDSPDAPGDKEQALLADFREIYSLPYSYLLEHAATFPTRWQLDSPYLEHFSQAFARFFMRVGLPAGIPKY